MGDFKHLSDIDNPNCRLKYWIASQSTVTKQKKKIKYLHQQTGKLKKKVKELDNVIDCLKKKKNKDSDSCITVLKVFIHIVFQWFLPNCSIVLVIYADLLLKIFRKQYHLVSMKFICLCVNQFEGSVNASTRQENSNH